MHGETPGVNGELQVDTKYEQSPAVLAQHPGWQILQVFEFLESYPCKV